jgi:hypothetical protein
VRYVGSWIQTERMPVPKAEIRERNAKAVNTYSVIQSVEWEPKPEPSQSIVPTVDNILSTRQSLRTSDKSTFIRDNELPRAPWGFMTIPGRKPPGAQTSSQPTNQRSEEVSATLQDSISRYGTPNNLTELELLSAALAKSLNLTSFPGFFDAPTGPPRALELHEQLDIYGYKPRQSTVEPIDYGVALVGKLKFAPPLEVEEGKELDEKV